MKNIIPIEYELFKVQLPLAGIPLILVYNEDGSIICQFPIRDHKNLVEYARKLFDDGWQDTPYKFFVWGNVDEKNILQLYPAITTKEDQSQDW